ncbi:MAG: diacylglycerol/lipid kinase family protein [Polyangiales bacterium]
MRATLLHNPKAGSAESDKSLIEAFEAIGWEIERCHSKKELSECLDDPGDVVVVAGGDGTVGKVAKRLAGTRTAMAIVPMGTANNVARSLGLGVDPKAAIASLARHQERVVDLGAVTSSRGTEHFVEGFGVGVFAYVVGERATKKHKKLPRALELLASTLERYEAGRFEIRVDGKDVSGNYLLAAVMNVRSFGPAIGLAPNAKIDDGELDVVLVGPESKDALLAHLRRATNGTEIALPKLTTRRAKHVYIRGDGRWAHVDDSPRELDSPVEIDVVARAVRVIVPAE